MKRFVTFAVSTASLIATWGPPAGVVQATPFVELGESDGIALDQPRIAVELIDGETSLGPTFSNTWLLDTGATTILAGNLAASEMTSQGANLTAGTHLEQGIAGSQLLDVSAAYRFDFADSEGNRVTLPQAGEDVRILSSPTLNLGSFGGIVGTPGMVNRISTIDYTVWSGGNIALIGIDFPATLPPHSDRYSAPLNLVDFPPAGPAPVPTSGPLPFMTVKWSDGGNETQGNVVLDTGAQISAINTQVGLDVGLDTNMDGELDSLDANWLFDQQVGGIGGSITVPVFNVGRIMIPTDQGVDLVWTNMAALVVDIDPSIAGLLGSDLLTSGWINALVGGEDGYLEHVHVDLTDAVNKNGSLVFDLNPTLNIVIPEPSTSWLLLCAGAMVVRRRRR